MSREEIFAYVENAPHDAPLFKLPQRRRREAADIQKKLDEHVRLYNDLEDKSRQTELLNDISKKTGACHGMKHEFYLQLLRRIDAASISDEDTKTSSTGRSLVQAWTEEMNLWRLFAVSVQKMTFPKALYDHFVDYIAEKFCETKNDPLLRKHASLVIDCMLKSDPKGNGARSNLSQRMDRARDLSSCKVTLLNDEELDMVYDARSLVDDILQQMSWSIGLRDSSAFALFIDDRATHRKLGFEGKIDDVLKELSSINTTGVEARLLMKRQVVGLGGTYANDPINFELNFCQARHQYLFGKYPVDPNAVIKLCRLLLKATDAVRDLENGWAEEDIMQNIPTSCTVSGGENDWVGKVNACLQSEEETSKERARNQFLAEVRMLDYAGAMFFNIEKASHFSPEARLPSPAMLGINLRGLHFFDKAPCGYRISFQLKQLQSCAEIQSSGIVEVLIKGSGDRPIKLETDDAFTLRGAIEAHMEYYKRDSTTLFRQTSRRRGRHSCGLGGGRIVETPISESNSRAVPALPPLPSSRPSESVSPSSLYSPAESEDAHDPDSGSIPSRTERRGRSRDSSSSRSCSQKLKHVIYTKSQKSFSKRKKSSPESSGGSEPTYRDQVSQQGVRCPLGKGTLFMQRYNIKEVCVDQDHLAYIAVDALTRKQRMLKFCNSAELFQNARECYQRLAHCQNVCQLKDESREDDAEHRCLILQWGGDKLATVLEDTLANEDRISIAYQVLKSVADMHRACIVHGCLTASNCFCFRKKSHLVVKLLLLDKIAMAGTIVTAGGSSSADPSSADGVSKEQLKRDPKFAANAVSCGLIVLRIFTNKELHPLVDSIEAAVAISGSNVDDACRKKITEAVESIDHAEARSLIESLLPNKSGQTVTVLDALNHSLFAGILPSATANVIPPSN